MSGVVRLPGELRDFLELPGPQTLLIRGAPGSGKTTLSLALLEAFRGEKILLTSRVPGRELHREFGWLGDNGGRAIHLIDTSEMDQSVQDVAQVMRHAREVLLAPRGADRESSQFLWLPPPLQDAWAQLSPTDPTLVIVDSWDALVESFLGEPTDPKDLVPDRSHLERLLIRRMSRAPAHLVFVLEREEQTSLDYLVNGVVVTRRETSGERLARWLTLHKLRGVRIGNPVYPFTLEGGRFESILPVRPYSSMRSGPPDPEVDAMPGHLWPGARAFAENFGRLPFGKITLIETDEQASSRIAELLLAPMMAHVLRSGGHVLLVPHSSDTPEDVFASLNGAVPEERFVQAMRLVIPPGPTPAGHERLWRVVVPLGRREGDGAASGLSGPDALRFLREGATDRSPSLLVLSLQGLGAVARASGISFDPMTSAQLPVSLVGTVRGQPIHALVVGREDSGLLDPLRAIATIRLSVTIRQGRIFLHGVAPWTPNFVLADGSGGHPYDLLRVV